MKKVILVSLAGLLFILACNYFTSNGHQIYVRVNPTYICNDSQKLEEILSHKHCIMGHRYEQPGIKSCWLPYDEKSWYFNPDCINGIK